MDDGDNDEKIRIQEMLQDLDRVMKTTNNIIRNSLNDFPDPNIPFYDRVSAEKRAFIMNDILPLD